jgi:hypothetical protein
MKCEKCGEFLKPTHFLGWPVSMWFEVQNILVANDAHPGDSPLAMISRIVEREEVKKAIEDRS